MDEWISNCRKAVSMDETTPVVRFKEGAELLLGFRNDQGLWECIGVLNCVRRRTRPMLDAEIQRFCPVALSLQERQQLLSGEYHVNDRTVSVGGTGRVQR